MRSDRAHAMGKGRGHSRSGVKRHSCPAPLLHGSPSVGDHLIPGALYRRGQESRHRNDQTSPDPMEFGLVAGIRVRKPFFLCVKMCWCTASRIRRRGARGRPTWPCRRGACRSQRGGSPKRCSQRSDTSPTRQRVDGPTDTSPTRQRVDGPEHTRWRFGLVSACAQTIREAP
jgi:hypothetical protein